jgi:DivIVA domain-containing protein
MAHDERDEREAAPRGRAWSGEPEPRSAELEHARASLASYVVRRDFRRTLRGYDPAEVEHHLEQVRGWFTLAGLDELAGRSIADAERRAARLLVEAEQKAARIREAARADGKGIAGPESRTPREPSVEPTPETAAERAPATDAEPAPATGAERAQPVHRLGRPARRWRPLA